MRTALGLAAPLCAFAAHAESEVERTWTQGRLTWLREGHLESGAVAASLLDAGRDFAGRKAPAVVYLHGCAGLDKFAAATERFLADAGYLVVSPDSFARSNKPVSCRIEASVTGLHRGVLAWRQAEAAYAVEQLRRTPFVDAERLYLYGFSEGGIAAATARDVQVRARVIEGWSCHAGWPEYRGLRTPANQPTLALSSSGDADATHGDCGDFMKGRFGSRSVVFRPPDSLSNQHYLSGRADVRATIVEFLRSR